jgi:hypothetical protein
MCVCVQDLYGFTFSIANVDPPFGLYTYPCQAIPLQVGTVQLLGLPSGTLINIERSTTIEFDPLLLYKELLPLEVRRSKCHKHPKCGL